MAKKNPVRNLCAMNEVVGFELVELNPLVDPGYTTALNANRIVSECLTGIAMRKRGMTEKGYLSPLTTEHGHDLEDELARKPEPSQ